METHSLRNDSKGIWCECTPFSADGQVGVESSYDIPYDCVLVEDKNVCDWSEMISICIANSDLLMRATALFNACD